MDQTEKNIQDLFDFIKESPTSFHAVENIVKRLEKEGFQKIEESEKWNLVAGNKYYVTRNDSSIISFILPKQEMKGFHIVAGHTDSPTFKIKANPEVKLEDYYVKLNTEKYGGMILSTWFDRPLSIAGRIYIEENNQITGKLICIEEDLLVIPNLAVHMNREINQGIAYNPQIDLLPIFSDNKKDTLYSYIADRLKIEKNAILSDELYLYTRQEGCTIGNKGQWIMAPRLDDLQCVYAGMEGICSANPIEYCSVACFFDNEEVGSGTKQGADSDFMDRILERISGCLMKSTENYPVLLSKSFLLSADNAHALHPNHPEKADLTNRPRMNGGIVIKYHGGQKYTTDAYADACLKKLCKENKIPYQTYCNRSDIPGGSTLGNISTTHVSVPSVDVGFAQLAMHSAVETAGREDIWYGIELFHAFLSQ